MTERERTSAAVPPRRPGALPDPPKTSGLAIASLVCGIAGLCTGVTAIVGLILGIMALRQIRRSDGRIAGNGMAIGGIATSCATLLVSMISLIVVVGVSLPAMAVAQQAAQAQRANAQARIVATSMVNYHRNYNSAFPPADDWQNALGVTSTTLGDSTRTLAFNEALDRIRAYDVADPANTVMLFEVPAGSPASGGRDLVAGEPAFRHGYLIVFVDTQAEFVPADDLDDLIWDPGAAGD